MAVVDTIIVDGFSYGFDYEDQRIDIDAALSSLSVISLYRAIKDARDSEAGMAYGVIATASGLDTLSGGVQTFLTVALQDNWEINTLRTSGQFTVGGGNLIRADGLDPFRDNPLITYINNLSQAGIVAETGVSGLTPQESTLLSQLATMAPQLLELWKLQGLDINNPLTVTPTQRTTDTIVQEFSGDGETSTTVTRTS